MTGNTFKKYCTCGGYAWQMNGRDPEQPHMNWCPQREEYAKWRAEQNATVGVQEVQKERGPKLVGHDECRCILQQYCDGTCRPIFDDADAVDRARILYAENPTYRGTTPLPWHYAPLEARREWVAKAKAETHVSGVDASVKGKQ